MMKKNDSSLHKMLTTYSEGDRYPFHMPGHKRQLAGFGEPWRLDITEIDGFDNLHHATGVLSRLQQRAAKMFGSGQSYLLVGGSTCGLLAAVSACLPVGGRLLLSRNCHKSVYHALELRQITPVYLMPKLCECGIMGSLSPEAVAQALAEDPDIDAVLVVSPTYDGVVSDISAIAAAAHDHGIPLIVDEAHGAHFPLCSLFPASALSCGADVVVQSLHKTLPAFTQTALLHLNSKLVFDHQIRRFLDIYQTSSPSYLLMASVDCCLNLLEREGPRRFSALRSRLDCFYDAAAKLTRLECFRPGDAFAWDDSKLLLSGRRLGLSGPRLSDLLRQDFGLELEMAAGHYALALCSLMDTEDGFLRLTKALVKTEERLSLNPEPLCADMINSSILTLPKQACSIAEAMRRPGRSLPLAEAAGCVSREYLYLYPPGIPLVVPGEYLHRELLCRVLALQEQDLELNGLADMRNQRINVVNF